MMFNTRALIGVMLLAVLGACATHSVQQEAIERVSFNANDYPNWKAIGTGEVAGQAFLVANDGEVKKAAGQAVYLMPDGPQAKQWFREVCVKGNKIVARTDNSDVVPQNFVRSVIADADGRFRFQEVGAGHYMLATTVFWKVYIGGHYARLQATGGTVARMVEVRPQTRSTVILSMENVCPGLPAR